MGKKNAEYLAEYLHDLGVFLHFKDDPSLHNTVFLNHEWVTTCVYKILDNPKIKNSHGRFNFLDLKYLWDDEKYRVKINELLSLMKNDKFELCFELSNNEYLAPQLLPEEPNSEFEEACKLINDSSNSKMKFEYAYDFMPKGILPRFIVRINKNITENFYYRYGVIIEHDDSKAIIKEVYAKNIISIFIFGNSKKELLGIIRNTFKDINNSFHNLVITERIPCNCYVCLNNDAPHLFEYKSIMHFIVKLKVKDIQCQVSGAMVNIDSLVNDVFQKNEFTNATKNTIITNNSTIIMKIENQNISNSQVNFADKIDNIEYMASLGIPQADFEKLLAQLKKLNSQQQDYITQEINIPSEDDSIEQQSQKREKIKKFLVDSGIAIAQNLSASGIYDLIKMIF